MMFKAVSRRLAKKPNVDEAADDEGKLIHNAILESFGIHFRVISEFLEKKKRTYDDDVLASDYLPEGTSTKTFIDDPKFEEYEKWINKRIAHLTYYRIDEWLDQKGWPIIAMGDALRNALLKFLAVARLDILPGVKEECNADWYQGLRPCGGNFTVVTTSTTIATHLDCNWSEEKKGKRDKLK